MDYFGEEFQPSQGEMQEKEYSEKKESSISKESDSESVGSSDTNLSRQSFFKTGKITAVQNIAELSPLDKRSMGHVHLFQDKQAETTISVQKSQPYRKVKKTSSKQHDLLKKTSLTTIPTAILVKTRSRNTQEEKGSNLSKRRGRENCKKSFNGQIKSELLTEVSQSQYDKKSSRLGRRRPKGIIKERKTERKKEKYEEKGSNFSRRTNLTRNTLVKSVKNNFIRNSRIKSRSRSIVPKGLSYTREDWFEFQTEWSSNKVQKSGGNVSKIELLELSLYERLKQLPGNKKLRKDIEKIQELVEQKNYEEILMSRAVFVFICEKCYNFKFDLADWDQKSMLDSLWSILKTEKGKNKVYLKDFNTFILFLWLQSEDFFPTFNVSKRNRSKLNRRRLGSAGDDNETKVRDFLQGTISKASNLALKVRKKPKTKNLDFSHQVSLQSTIHEEKETFTLLYKLYDYGQTLSMSKAVFEVMIRELMNYSLSDFLRDVPCAEESFQIYLKEETNEELILFYLLVKRKLANSEIRDWNEIKVSIEEAKEIRKQYLDPESSTPLNISDSVRTKALKAIAVVEKKGKTCLCLDFLKPVYEEVFRLMESDTFTRYISKLCKDPTENTKEKYVLADVIWKKLGLSPTQFISFEQFKNWASHTGRFFEIFDEIKETCLKIVSIR